VAPALLFLAQAGYERIMKEHALARRGTPASDKNQIQVISRAAAILRVVEQEGTGLSLGQIAGRVGLARSTVQRIVNALEGEGLLFVAGAAGKVVLGPALLRLARTSGPDFAEIARPQLTKLSGDLQETVDLAAIRKDRATFIDQVIGPQRLRAVSAIGESFPLYCTANGKAYLATLEDEQIERLLGRSFERRTPSTITNLNDLISELNEARAQGFAFDREEHTVGICAAGVAMPDHLGNPHAISVPVPTARFVDEESNITKHLLKTKAILSKLVEIKGRR
jgi:DNA-binding IclR family transcriptional regulator